MTPRHYQKEREREKKALPAETLSAELNIYYHTIRKYYCYILKRIVNINLEAHIHKQKENSYVPSSTNYNQPHNETLSDHKKGVKD